MAPLAAVRSVVTPLLVAAATIGTSWLLLWLDALEEKSTGPGYTPVPDLIGVVAGVSALLVLPLALTALVLWVLRRTVAVPLALGLGVLVAGTGLLWTIYPEDEGALYVGFSVLVGVLLVVTTGLLVPARTRQWPPPRRLPSLGIAIAMIVAGVACAGIAVFFAAALWQWGTDNIDLLGRYEEDEVLLAYLFISALGTVVFTTPALALLGAVVRGWPSRARRQAPSAQPGWPGGPQ